MAPVDDTVTAQHKSQVTNTDAVSMLKIKKPKIPQFGIIFTYSYNKHAIKLLSRCSTNFVGSSTPPTWTMFFKARVGSEYNRVGSEYNTSITVQWFNF